MGSDKMKILHGTAWMQLKVNGGWMGTEVKSATMV